MISLFRVTTVAAVVWMSSLSCASAQSFEQMTRDGQQALRSGDWARALDLRNRQLSMPAPKPEDHCFVYWGLFTAHIYGSGDMAKALQAADDSLRCLQAIRSSSRDMIDYRVEAQRYRALTLSDWGRYDDALAVHDERQRMQSTPVSGIDSSRANILELKKDHDGAAAALTRAAAAAPNAPDRAYAINRRAWIRLKQGRIGQAKDDLAEANRISPHVAGRDSNPRAWMLVETGNYDDAIAEMKADERAGGPNAAAYTYLRGYIEAARGNFSEATAAFRTAAAAQSANVTVQVALYLAQARSGQADTSALSAMASRLSPAKWPDAQLFYVIGIIDRAQFEAAARFGNPRMERGYICRMYLVAGEIALIKRDTAGGKAELNRAVEICPVDTAAQERTWARGELSRL